MKTTRIVFFYVFLLITLVNTLMMYISTPISNTNAMATFIATLSILCVASLLIFIAALVRKRFTKKLLLRFKNPFIHGSLLIRKKVMNEINYYNEDFYYAQDYKLFTDLMNSGYKIKILNKVLYKLNTINNISTLKKEQQQYYAECVRKNTIPHQTY